MSYVSEMKATTYTEFRKNLASTMDAVSEDFEPLLITRSGGKKSAVLISLEDYQSFEETAYLMKSPKNAKRLLSAIENLEAGRGAPKDLVEPEPAA